MLGESDISNNTLMARMSIEGWIGLIVVLAGIIASHTTLANNTERNEDQVAENKKAVQVVQADVGTIKTDVAIIKNEQEHINKVILDMQREQRKILDEIKKLPRQ